MAQYTEPVVLSVNGATSVDSKFDQLAMTSPVKKVKWQYFELMLKPSSDATYLVLQAYFDVSKKEAYNGNILIDGLELVEL